MIDTTNGKLKQVKCLESLHESKILGIDASIGGIVTCSSDKTVKIIQPDLSMDTIANINKEQYGDVSAVSHWRGVLALGHSDEVIRFYDRSDVHLE